MNKPLIPPAPGEAYVTGPGGVTRTQGDMVKNSIDDALFVGSDRAYGAFDGFEPAHPSEKVNQPPSFGECVPAPRRK